MLQKTLKKNLLSCLYVGGALLILLAAWLWFAKISTDPERVFWGTMEQGLSTRDVTVQAEQETGVSSAKQTVRYSLGANSMSHSLTTLQQQGTTVQNEMIATPTTDYTRYVNIKTDQKKADGSPINFSKLLGVWAKSEEGSGQFFSQSVFGASLPVGGMGVPIGNPGPEVRAKLVKQMRSDKTYSIDFAKTKKEKKGGRTIYTYEATVHPQGYVSLMKEFSKGVGLHGLEQIDPANYKNQKAFTLQISVDARSRHVVQIASPETNSKQTYSSYDVPVRVELPKKAISAAELQQILSTLQ